jgi:hypothetical protein
VVLLTEGGDRPSARARLEQVIGTDLTDRVLTRALGSPRPAE